MLFPRKKEIARVCYLLDVLTLFAPLAVLTIPLTALTGNDITNVTSFVIPLRMRIPNVIVATNDNIDNTIPIHNNVVVLIIFSSITVNNSVYVSL